MSSHHFVREGQEPALFVIDPVPFRYIGPLLEWAPLIVVSAVVLDFILPWGIKVDVVIVPHDDVDDVAQKLLGHHPVTLLNCVSEGDIIETGFRHLVSHKHQSVNIAAAAAEVIFNKADAFPGALQINILDEQYTWLGVTSGRFEKWLPIGTRLLVRKSRDAQSVYIQGQATDNGVYEAILDGILTVTSTSPFWVGEAHV